MAASMLIHLPAAMNQGNRHRRLFCLGTYPRITRATHPPRIRSHGQDERKPTDAAMDDDDQDVDMASTPKKRAQVRAPSKGETKVRAGSKIKPWTDLVKTYSALVQSTDWKRLQPELDRVTQPYAEAERLGIPLVIASKTRAGSVQTGATTAKTKTSKTPVRELKLPTDFDQIPKGPPPADQLTLDRWKAGVYVPRQVVHVPDVLQMDDDDDTDVFEVPRAKVKAKPKATEQAPTQPAPATAPKRTARTIVPTAVHAPSSSSEWGLPGSTFEEDDFFGFEDELQPKQQQKPTGGGSVRMFSVPIGRDGRDRASSPRPRSRPPAAPVATRELSSSDSKLREIFQQFDESTAQAEMSRPGSPARS